MNSALKRQLVTISVIAIILAMILFGFVSGFSWQLLGAAVVASIAVVIVIQVLTPNENLDLEEVELAMRRLAGGEPPDKVRLVAIGELAELKQILNDVSMRFEDRLSAARLERNRLETILAEVGDAIFVVNSNSEITRMNTAARRLFNLHTEKSVGQTLIQAVQDHEIDQVLQKCLQECRQQKAFVENSPGKRFFGVISSPLKSEPGAVVLIQDLTELKRLEKVRRDFVANISHELRTPLSSLKLLAETLSEGAINDPEVAREFMFKISVEVDKLSQMVRELSELSRIESGEAPLHKNATDINALAERAMNRMRALAERAALSLEMKSEPGLPSVSVDAERIEQVLVNLLHNAIKFTPAGGHISLTTRMDNGKVELSVRDTGIGIPSDDLPRIFERFFKADKSRSTDGTGLGLAIAKHLVKAHGGDIRAESTPGEGTIIRLNLPL